MFNSATMTFLISKLKFIPTRSLVLRNKFKISNLQIFKTFSSSESEPVSDFVYEPEFTTDQQKYILQTLNEANNEQLARYSLSKNRIKKLDNWRRKNGQFNKLVDVLDIDGLGVKSLDKLCKSILNGDNVGDESELKETPIKTRGQFLTPSMSSFQMRDLKSALGVHLYATGISWAKIEKEQNSLVDWNCFDYNLGTKKLSPTDALQLIIDLSHEIPMSDVYVFEAPVSVTPTAQQSPVSVAAYTQRVQLLSMLITLLSTSPKHNPSYLEMHQARGENKNAIQLENKIFFLRNQLPARLFHTLIGNERVSAATTVTNILSNTTMEKIIYSPLTVNSELKDMYDMQAPISKEVLGQTLLLIMTFMDACIYRNSNSMQVISSSN